MMQMCWLLLSALVFVSCDAVHEGVAPFITACHAADAECHKSSAQKAVAVLAGGVPTLGLHPLDPMQVGEVDADQAGLKIQFRNTVVKGLRNCVVLSLKRKGPKQNLELKCSVTLIGDYTMSGKLLILPVEGDGKYKIKIRDIVVKVSYDTGEKAQRGDKYWTLTSWKYTSEVQTGCEFQFQNLFNGNKQMSDAVHQFANSNWREIFEEVAPPIVKAVVAKIVQEVAKFFDKVPIRELALD